MSKTASVAAVVVASSLLCSGAAGAVASTTAIVQEITSQYAGQPGYVGLQTWAVFIAYENPGDVMIEHAFNQIDATSGTFFNAHPVSDDPLGLIPNSPCCAGAPLCPISSAILATPGYALWAWDTNLSLDNSSLSIPDLPFFPVETPTMITGGAFLVPPPIGAAAGADLMIQIAQITMTAGGSASGEGTLVTLNPAGGNPIPTNYTIDVPGRELCPADLSGDGEINSVDLGILLASWSIPHLTPGCGGKLPCPADLNGDGSVNSFDLGILLSQWGGC